MVDWTGGAAVTCKIVVGTLTGVPTAQRFRSGVIVFATATPLRLVSRKFLLARASALIAVACISAAFAAAEIIELIPKRTGKISSDF